MSAAACAGLLTSYDKPELIAQQPSIAVIQTRDRSPVANEAARREVDATLMVKPDGITGVVTVGGDSYSITPLGDGQHVITKSANEGQLPDHPPEAKRPKPPASDDTPLCQTTTANEDADILVLYTPGAKSALATVVRDEPDWAIGSLAATLKASDTRAGVRLLDVRELNYTESASMETDVERIAAMPEAITAQRDTGADLVVTYVADGKDAAGRRPSACTDRQVTALP